VNLKSKKSNSLKEFEFKELHFLEPDERIEFVNELWRVLKPDGKCTITCPHWCSSAYYCDLRVKWPPVSEQWAWNLNKFWREKNKIKAPYNCNFHVVPAFGGHPLLTVKSQEFSEFALQFYKESAQSLILNLTKYPMDKEP
jgi:hypothetical protein